MGVEFSFGRKAIKKGYKVNSKEITHVFLLGIGGIGMSALARYFLYKGAWVGGYDLHKSPLSTELEGESMHIIYEDDPSLIPSFFNEPGPQVLIIYTPSIPSKNRIKNTLSERGFELRKRSYVLGKICLNYRVIAVAGTHGKTTTCTLISHLLKVGGIDCISFLGGISSNYKTNFLPGLSEYAVVEADEYDRSFLTLFPEIGVITSMDADHLDIYGNLKNMILAFNQFASQIKVNGIMLTRRGLKIDTQHLEYSIQKDKREIVAEGIEGRNIRVLGDLSMFDYYGGKSPIKDIKMHTPGFHNIENAVAAIAVCLQLGITDSKIKKGLDTFMGVKRRFEYVWKGSEQIYIDDYAHHQDELTAFLHTVRALYPQKFITAIFQPHLYTRTRDFYAEMAKSLSLVDQLYLMPIYPAREEPIDGVGSELIFNSLELDNKYLLNPEEILSRIEKEKTEVVLTIGAGDIDKLCEPIRKILEKKESLSLSDKYFKKGGSII